MRGEDGFTLPEVLTALAVGTVVLMAAFGLLDTAIGLTNRVTERVDATQRARIAMDAMTRDLRSQVCPTPFTPSMIAASDTSVDFYVDLGDGAGSKPLERRTLTYDATANTIVETIYRATGTPGAYTFPTTATRRHTLLTNVFPTGSEPIFEFFAFNGAASQQTASTQLSGTTGLSTANLAKVVRIVIQYTVRGGNAKSTNPRAAEMQDEVYIRLANSDQTSAIPVCPPTA